MTALRLHALWRGSCPLLGDSLFVWAQGCPRRCKGCFNTGALDESGPALRRRPSTVARRWAHRGGGLVLSGGEPFLQAEGLAELCRQVRALAPDAPILTYTGYLLEDLLAGGGPGWLDLLRQTDVLVDGPYHEEIPSPLALLGSGNQRVFFLSGRVEAARLASMPPVQVQADLDGRGRVRLVGTGDIDMRRLVVAMKSQGLELEE